MESYDRDDFYLKKVLVRYKEKQFASITIETEHCDSNKPFIRTTTYKEEPQPNRQAALNKLLECGTKIAQLAVSWHESGFVSGVKLTRTSEGELTGYAITMQHQDEATDAIQCVTTRHITEGEIHSNEFNTLALIESCCLGYLKGDRLVREDKTRTNINPLLPLPYPDPVGIASGTVARMDLFQSQRTKK